MSLSTSRPRNEAETILWWAATVIFATRLLAATALRGISERRNTSERLTMRPKSRYPTSRHMVSKQLTPLVRADAAHKHFCMWFAFCANAYVSADPAEGPPESNDSIAPPLIRFPANQTQADISSAPALATVLQLTATPWKQFNRVLEEPPELSQFTALGKLGVLS